MISLYFHSPRLSGVCITDLITIAPGKFLCSDVLVRVLHPLLQRWQMFPVLPMLTPEIVGIDTGDNQTGNGDTVLR